VSSAIKISILSAQQAASNILNGNKAQIARLRKAQQIIDQLPGSWSSPASAQLAQISAKMKRDLNAAEAQINRHGNFLGDVALAYMDAEDKITAPAKSLGG